LFSFWHLQPDSYPFARVKGIYRFETGIKVNEFRDLRANPRCLLESQILSFRVKWARLISTGVLGNARKSSVSPTPPPSLISGRSNSVLSSLGLSFDPYDPAPLPARILATGAAANFPSVSNLVGDIFNAPVFVPLTQIDSAQISPHRNAPADGYPSRVALGGAYVARWVWSREWGTGGLGVFEDEMKRLLGKRWVATNGALLRSNINGATVVGGLGGNSGANSGTSTPYGHPGSRSGLGSTVFVEEDEDYEIELERNALANPGVIGASVYGTSSYADTNSLLSARLRTQTGSTAESSSSGGLAPSSAFTTPDLGLGNLGIMTNAGGLSAPTPSNGSGGAATPTTPTPLTPVVALTTSDAEAQLGLAKVAEPDVDAFMTYAAIVPEYSRLETMVVKGIV
jgi:xylulokinase